ncbi:hypothetical protein CWE09_11375 [Aliidiomarina minuta]|uniref:DUF2971 domain-containing protein n=1 Tax=Aliidiomarina minuta TaxID=880057 RepID=A0A432W4M3_9GAMM|nr:DUF2971 domain-containing protein [Aliidiomarina minuta]RUO24451.1 hypothetical protein CWE09_11375 [Aliidiomarina minuta]
MSKPEYLYHYTSIEGLAHILESRQIRFSRLDLLDDVTEGQSQDAVDWRKYYFVSCWTAEEEESIPLWSMYTPDMMGVRIKLPLSMFKTHIIDHSELPRFIQLADTSKAPPGAKIQIRCLMPYEKLHGEDYFVMNTCFRDEVWPSKVEYTDDPTLLNQNLIKYNKETDTTSISSDEIAKYKKKVWSFQYEWRFKIHCFNAAPRSLKSKMPNDSYNELMLRELRNFEKGVSQEYFFMDLDDLIFDSLEVVLGPKVDSAHKIIVNSLIQNFCSKAKVSPSRLTGQIR